MLFCRQEKFRLNNGTIIKNGCGFTCIFAKNTVMTQGFPNSSQFIEKLASKNQSAAQQMQAQKSIECYLLVPIAEARNKGRYKVLSLPRPNFRCACPAKLNSRFRQKANAAWREADVKLKNEIMLRHYSPKTLKSYLFYTQKFRGSWSIKTLAFGHAGH